MTMRRKLMPAAIGLVSVLLMSSAGCYRSAACKRRGQAYLSRIETLGRDAHEKLTIGTKKDAVVRFFEEHGIPVTLYRDEMTGAIQTTGCPLSFGCGDAALLALRVKVDDAGTVVAEPVVETRYTNCL